MPYLNRPYRSRPWYLDYISRYIDPPEDSPPQTNFVAELAPFPTHFLRDGQAVFPLSKRKDAIRISKMVIKPDAIIYATGYTQEFGYLDEASCYPFPQDADLRSIARTGDEDFAFIGYVRPGVGKCLATCCPNNFRVLIYVFRCHPSACRDASLFLDFTNQEASRYATVPPVLSSPYA